jgi:hypothetical protein
MGGRLDYERKTEAIPVKYLGQLGSPSMGRPLPLTVGNCRTYDRGRLGRAGKVAKMPDREVGYVPGWRKTTTAPCRFEIGFGSRDVSSA